LSAGAFTIRILSEHIKCKTDCALYSYI
jgi:hypothetical protein